MLLRWSNNVMIRLQTLGWVEDLRFFSLKIPNTKPTLTSEENVDFVGEGISSALQYIYNGDLNLHYILHVLPNCSYYHSQVRKTKQQSNAFTTQSTEVLLLD